VTAPIIPAPQKAVLPLSLGRDVVLTFRNRVPDSNPVQYTNFPAGVSVRLVIGKGDSQVTGLGVVSGSSATCRIESSSTDSIKAGTFWRVVVSVGSDDQVPLNGTVVRADGA
jgi:hypothetical protein